MTDVTPRFKDRKDPPRKRRKRIPPVGKTGLRNRDDLAATKPVVMARARGWCEAQVAAGCAVRGNQQHHVTRRAQGGTNVAENLLWVCGPCHLEIHADQDTARALGLLKRSTDA